MSTSGKKMSISLKSVIASAPGKIILFGEHSVVYKQPAIAVAVSKYSKTYVYPNESIASGEVLLKAPDYNNEIKIVYNPQDSNLPRGFGKLFHPVWIILREMIKDDHKIFLKKGITIEISSKVPRGSGMGSSASLWVSCAKALSESFEFHFNDEKISKIAFEAEKFVHGNPSGIDNSVSTFGGGILFENGKILPLILPKLSMVVGDTQKARRTRDMVARVGERQKNWTFYNKIIQSIGELVLDGIDYLLKGDAEKIGELLDINHGLLDALGVSSPELNRMVEATRAAGAYGAKLTGGGGGGCMIALCSPQTQQKVSQAIKELGGIPYLVQISQQGAQIENIQ